MKLQRRNKTTVGHSANDDSDGSVVSVQALVKSPEASYRVDYPLWRGEGRGKRGAVAEWVKLLLRFPMGLGP